MRHAPSCSFCQDASEPKKNYIWIEHESVYLACEDSPQRTFSFALYLVFFLPSWLLLYIDFVAFSLVSPTIACVQHSTLQNMYAAEDQPHCLPHLPLSRSAVLPCPRPPSSVHHISVIYLWLHVTHEFCACTWVQIDIPEHGRHVRMYACTLWDRSLIQNLMLMRSAIRQNGSRQYEY